MGIKENPLLEISFRDFDNNFRMWDLLKRCKELPTFIDSSNKMLCNKNLNLLIIIIELLEFLNLILIYLFLKYNYLSKN